MKRRKLVRAILLLAILATAVMIFCFSSQNGEQSKKTSDRVTKTVVHWQEPNYDRLPVVKQQAIWKRVGLTIRKLAHFSEFALLGALLFVYLFLSPRERKTGMTALIAFGATALYAVSDEMHQMLVEDRGPSPIDVGIDCLGAMLAIVLVAGIWLLVRRLRARRGER